VKFNPQADISSFKNWGPENSALLRFTYDIDVAPDSSIWFASGGLVRYNPNDGQWISFEG